MSTSTTTLRDRLFPPASVDGNTLRIGLVGTWEAQFLGLGRLTKFLTAELPKRTYGADDMGIYLVFLQRHRVEVGLKLILERVATPTTPTTHDLNSLLGTCKGTCRATHPGPFDRFDRQQREYIQLLQQVDPGAASFRYPVDTAAVPWQREDLADLAEFEIAGAAFESDVMELIGSLATLEPLPVADTDAHDIAAKLADFADAANTAVSSQTRAMAVMIAERDRLLALTGKSKNRNHLDVEHSAFDGYRSVLDVAHTLAQRTERMLDRIVEHHPDAAPQRIAPPDLPPHPPTRLSPDPQVLNAQASAQMKWGVDILIAYMRPLAHAVEALASASENWATPAARQVHLDVERFRSRLQAAWTAPETER